MKKVHNKVKLIKIGEYILVECYTQEKNLQ